jgi:hypothetical protein
VSSKRISYTFQMWQPMVGDHIARRLSRAAVVRQARLPLIVFFVVGVFPYQLTRTMTAAVFAASGIFVLVAGTIVLTAIYRRMLNAIELSLQSDLRLAGLSAEPQPSLRSIAALEWWLEMNGIKNEEFAKALRLGVDRGAPRSE